MTDPTDAALALTGEQVTRLLAALGLPADTTDPELLLATIDDLVEQAGDSDDGQAPNVAAAAARAGLEVIDADTLAALRHDANEGRQLAAAAARQATAAHVENAIRAGKIPPARREHWQTLIAADPGMADVLAKLPANTIPVDEVGHGHDPDPGRNPHHQDQADEPDWFY